MDLLWQIEGLRTPLLDTIFGLITRLGEEMILIPVFCIIFWCINKKMAYVLGFSFFMSSLFVQGAKIIFRVPRPWVYDPTFSPVGGALGASTGYAFPSGHTQNAAALLGSLGAQIKQKLIKVVLFVLVFLVAFSRMYLGVHYLSDVVVSLVISFVIIWLATRLITEDSVSKKREALIAGSILLVAIAVFIIAAVIYSGGLSTAAQLRDATRSAGAASAFAIGMFVERNYIKFSVKAQNLAFQFLKVIIGVAILIGIQEGGRIMGSSLAADAFRYFLMVIWLTLIYPLIIKRFFTKKEAAK